MSAVDPAVMRLVRGVARVLTREGASAVVLTGSHARGDASPASDVDLIALYARKPRPQPASVRVRDGRLVTVAATTPSAVRADFKDPRRFTTYVPGWREAIIIVDADGAAARLQDAAHRWSWADVEGVADAWVASEIAGWAEEVLKLYAAVQEGRALHAATQRSLLAVQLAGVMAVRHRILCGTENLLWDLVAAAMGEPWASVQMRALGMHSEPLEASCRGALELYALAAREAWPLLDRGQRAVAGHACGVAGISIGVGAE